jgi:hypothetical protein
VQNCQLFFGRTVISLLVDHFLSEVMPYEWTGRFYGPFTEKVFKIAGHLAFDPSKAFGVGSADKISVTRGKDASYDILPASMTDSLTIRSSQPSSRIAAWLRSHS